MIISMELDYQRVPLTSKERQYRVEFRKLNDLYLYYDSHLHHICDCLITPKLDDPHYREPHSRTSTPSVTAQLIFNFIMNSVNDSIVLESINDQTLCHRWSDITRT